ncbi:cation:H+ antiporter [Lewinella marina]|uniref:Sodium:proton exchanger n=1 Tax=Neolewinella marina TaxID=438751 RepID=A0A2G0CAP3_9BACT|nr:calcium/sodium antiporter [Neolewinella marina]NJB84299.1 cation:H+ antiporter [Neolewinella marina]PHK97044.1 sodium:proton exchanger [Neolewinella marina]
MLLSIGFILAGFVLLIFGADWLVDGASSLARKHRVSDLVIGLTIVSFGTSAPELVVNLIASLEGHSDIVYGNVVGSNNFNLFVILGIAGLILPITVQRSTVWQEIPMSLAAAVVLLLLSNNFFLGGALSLSRLDGVLLLVCFAAFLWYVFRQMRAEVPPLEPSSPVYPTTLRIVGLIVFGLAGLVFGGKLVVDHAIAIATSLGVSEKIIGLTIIAAGTSLPELVTSAVAAFKKNSDIAIGNVVGSNIFNALFVISLSAVVHPIGYNASFNREIYLLIGGTIFLFTAMFLGGRKRLDRWEAGLLLLVYGVYLGLQIAQEV